MSLLQFIISVSAVIFILFGVDLYHRKRATILHFLVFLGGGTLVILFSLNNQFLNTFGSYFGLARGADLIVYISIIVLFYMMFMIINSRIKDTIKYVDLAREFSISGARGDYKNAETVFVIPCYNEGENALEVTNFVLDAGHGIVFIDDGSRSDYIYQEALRRFSDRNFVGIRHIVNLGQGGALQTGFSYVLRNKNNVKYVVTFDSDGQHQLKDLAKFYDEFGKDKSLEIVLGSRFLGEAVNIPYMKKITLKLGIIFTWIFSGIKLTDTHNGFRMIAISSLDKIKITMPGFQHASEIIDIIKNKKLKYKEVPITVLYTEYSMSKGQSILNAFRIAWDTIYNKLFFR